MLTKRDHIVLDTLLPAGGNPDLEPGYDPRAFSSFYAKWKSDAVFSMWIGFVAALFVCVWIAPMLIGKIPPISLYKRETREQVLMALYNSKYNVLRQVVFLLKATVSFWFGTDDRVRDALGYPVQFDSPRAKAAAGQEVKV